MPLPRGDEYVSAVQNPRSAFTDAGLKDCTPEVDQFGIPKPYSGGFTTTFHLADRSQEWAVRCFTRAISDLQERYAAIDRFLAKNTERFLVGTFYLSQGIQTAGQWHPIIKMQWVKGDTLNSFIEKNIGNIGRIKKLIPEFVSLVRRLQHLKVAHGDLQHGNILVRDDKLFLIDYDGIFLPKLAHLKTNEIGHPNYQHPGRNASHYGPSIDRFSSIAIYVGLRAIAESPGLWTKYDDSENVLFRAHDFADPGRSGLFRELSALPKLSVDIDRFHGVCKLPLDDVPDLETFISGRFQYPAVAVSPVATPAAAPRAVAAAPVAAPSPTPKAAAVPRAATPPPSTPTGVPPAQGTVLDGANIDALRRHVGQRVEVVGSVSQLHASKKKLFLNFGAHPAHTFTLVLRSSSLKAFQRSGIDPHALAGKRIKVSGVMASYGGKPGIEVKAPAQIQVLGGNSGAQPVRGSVAVATAARPQQHTTADSPESVFDKLYAGRPTSGRPIPPSPAQAAPPHVRGGRPPSPPSSGRAISASPAQTAPPRVRGGGPPSGGASRMFSRLLAVVWLGVIGWAIWVVWRFAHTQ
jgi:serine/threonine protein kinase